MCQTPGRCLPAEYLVCDGSSRALAQVREADYSYSSMRAWEMASNRHHKSLISIPGRRNTTRTLARDGQFSVHLTILQSAVDRSSRSSGSDPGMVGARSGAPRASWPNSPVVPPSGQALLVKLRSSRQRVRPLERTEWPGRPGNQGGTAEDPFVPDRRRGLFLVQG